MPDPLSALPRYADRLDAQGKIPLLMLLVAFLVTFALTRAYTRLARVRGWGSLHVREVHVHHLVVGILLVLGSGAVAFAVPRHGTMATIAATAFGVGAAFTLDEFALWLHLDDVYWADEGRKSIDAAIVATLVLLMLLHSFSPYGLGNLGRSEERDRWAAVAVVAANLVLVLLTILKGKLKTGAIGVVVPGVSFIGALRLARPGSPWAHTFYRDPSGLPAALRLLAVNGEEKASRARERAEHGLSAHVERRLHDLIGGRPHLPSPRR